jgi:hypothetical protein
VLEIEGHQLNDSDYVAKYLMALQSGAKYSGTSLQRAIQSGWNNHMDHFLASLVAIYKDQIGVYVAKLDAVEPDQLVVVTNMTSLYLDQRAGRRATFGHGYSETMPKKAVAQYVATSFAGPMHPESYGLFLDQGISVRILYCFICGMATDYTLSMYDNTLTNAPLIGTKNHKSLWFLPSEAQNLDENSAIAGICGRPSCPLECLDCGQPFGANLHVGDWKFVKQMHVCKSCGLEQLTNLGVPQCTPEALKAFCSRFTTLRGGRYK